MAVRARVAVRAGSFIERKPSVPEKSAVRARVPLETGPLYREISVFRNRVLALKPKLVTQNDLGT